ncbi:MAG TPA: SAF domain-containing protein, partial [Nitriliruptorales bacterium]|nr:SAF domain-containing protein [Nitriliruptorales bacterium]
MEPPRSLAARWRRALEGPPPVLPAPLDRASERWAAAPPRMRAAVVVVAVLVLATIAGRGAATSPWGPPVRVVVATHDLPAGHTLTTQDLRAVTWPRDVAPDDAVGGVGPALGRSLSSGLVAGAALTGRHLGSGGLGAALPAGRAAVPLPLPEGVTVTVGQRLDV